MRWRASGVAAISRWHRTWRRSHERDHSIISLLIEESSMRISAQFGSAKCPPMVVAFVLVSCVGLINFQPTRGAEAATASPVATPEEPKAQDKPVVSPPEKKATPEPSPIPAGPTKETPG